MASRVNTRFVAFLAIGLMLLGGGVMVAAYFALKKSGGDYVRLGDQYLTEGDFEKASSYYSKAVFTERTNAEWIDKWIHAMEKTTPTPMAVYLDRYQKEYLPALKAYGDAQPDDVKAQRRFLDEAYETLRMNPPRQVETWNDFILKVEDAIKRFDDPEGPARELRRYRAFANRFKQMVLPSDRANELTESIRADLEAALAANPADALAEVELASTMLRQADDARRARDNATADALVAEASARLEKFQKEHGPDLLVYWSLMQIDFVKAAQTAEITGVPMSRAQLYLDHHARFVELLDMIRAQPKGKLDPFLLANICLEASRSSKIGNAGVLELLYELEQKHPESIFLRMLIGRYEMYSQHFDKAFDAYQKVIQAPDLPLSYVGMILFDQRAEAYRQQILAKLAERDVVRRRLEAGAVEGIDPGAPAAALAEAKRLRDKLADYAGETEPVLLYVDAKIAYAEGDFESARINLDRYNERTGNRDLLALLLQGEIMEQMRNVGAARTAYVTALSLDPDNANAHIHLARLEEFQQNFCEAKRHLEEVKKLYPTEPELDEKLSQMSQLCIGEKSVADVTDEVVRAVLEAQELVSGVNPDFAASAEVLRAALDKTGHLSLYPMLARVLHAAGQREEALAVVNRGLDKAPGNPALLRMREIFKVEDPLEATILAIEADDKATPVQKGIWKYVAYSQARKPEEAKRWLEEVTKLEPENPVVMELRFGGALEAGDMGEARRLADIAATKNLDHVNGLWYKAQIEIAENRFNDSGATLEAALEKDRNSVRIWRQLGNVRLATQKADLAATAFERALAIRPQDTESIKGFIQAKIALGERDRALEFARQNQDYAVHDMDFVDTWLSLESLVVGGDRSRALELRQALAKRFPNNVRNNTSLGMLLIDAQRFAEAKSMIDRLRAESKEPAYVELEIRWHAAQRNMRAAVETFNNWVVTLPKEEHDEDPYIALAGVFADYGRYDAAVVALEDGRVHQDPKRMGCDRKLGEVLFLMRQYERAIDTLDRVLAADPSDPDFKIRGQIVEAYTRLRRFEDARRRLDAMGASVESSPRMLLLKADVLAGQGQLEEAERTYDAAVASAKSDPIGYLKRAEFLANYTTRLGDAEQDLRQALAISPRHLGARQRLAALHLRNNQPERAIETLREGLQNDPDNDALRLDLIGLHLQRKEDVAAIGTVEEALKRRPEDPVWLFRGREVMYALNRWNDAAGYAWRLWEKKKDADAALAYVDAVLKTPSPDYVKAIEVLRTPELKTEQNLYLLTARARVQLKRNRGAEARQDLERALALIDPANPAQAQSFLVGMTVVYPDPAERLAAMTALRPQDGYRVWLAFFYSNLKSSIAEHASEGIAELKSIAESNADLTLRKQSYAVIGSRIRAEGKYEEAINWWKEGLKLDPADPELNNNVAYATAVDLKKPREALPFAQKAVQAMGNSASILDTLGTVHLMLDDLPRADEALTRALSLAQATEERVAVMVHLAELRLRQGKREEAAAFLRRSEELMKDNEVLQKQYEAQIKELKEKINAN